MVGSSFYKKGGNMLKKITIPLMILMLLGGCTPAGGNIVLSDAQSEILLEKEPVTENEQTAPDGNRAVSSSEAVPDGNRAESLSETGTGSEQEYTNPDYPGTGEGAQQADRLAVYVCGAVLKEGVYELVSGSRIVDAVEAAGGFSEDADTTYVNLAARLTDGTKLLIPTLEQTADRVVASGIDSFSGDTTLQTASVSEGSGGNGLVNINTADKEELKSLNGIGDSTAEKIIRYRQDNGGFRTIEDIMKISGIKEKLFSKIKDNITV